MLARWIVGLLGCAALFWVAGHHTVDSILVRVADPQLGVVTLRPGDTIRWRSEGWATTRIGPHGLPGWDRRDTDQRIILWGDSQVEGVTVNDPEKIHNQAIGSAGWPAGSRLDCLPLGRSGSDARHWIALTEAAEALWQPELHVWIVTDFDDLWALADPQDAETARRFSSEPSPAPVRWAAALRADALIAAVKRIAYDPETGRTRRLDFSLGPRTSAPPEGTATAVTIDKRLLQQVAGAITAHGRQRRLALVYAPATPRILDQVTFEHPHDAAFDALVRVLDDSVTVVDLRAAFAALWRDQQRFPRGFHNGMPGLGHLNVDGNRIVAEAVVAIVAKEAVAGELEDGAGRPAP